MLPGLFITGTDTGVGKTRVGVALVSELHRRGLRVRVRKPVESGCALIQGALLPADAAALRAAAGNRESLAQICPYPLAAPLAPPRAAALAGCRLHLADLVAACVAGVGTDDFMLVEGAGGFLSPLAEDALNADLALALEFPVLLVAEDRLGAIHQVLASAEAIERRGLRLAALVLNAVHAAPDPALENAQDLAGRLAAPVFSLAHRPDRTAEHSWFPAAWLEGPWLEGLLRPGA